MDTISASVEKGATPSTTWTTSYPHQSDKGGT
jgi:hypothetical protein